MISGPYPSLQHATVQVDISDMNTVRCGLGGCAVPSLTCRWAGEVPVRQVESAPGGVAEVDRQRRPIYQLAERSEQREISGMVAMRRSGVFVLISLRNRQS